jgi:hypothetical protein
MTPETLAFLLDLLNSVTVSGADPDLVMRAQQIAQARTELTAALASAAE